MIVPVSSFVQALHCNVSLSSGTFQPYVNCTDQHRRTPLLVAVQHGQRAVCAVLLEFRADVEYPDDFGVSPMSLAAFLVRSVAPPSRLTL